MDIKILCHVDVLRAKNHPNIAIQFADAITKSGHTVELVIPFVYRKDNIKIKNIPSYYGVCNNFKITFLKTLLFRNSPQHVYTLVLVLAHSIRAMMFFVRNFFMQLSNGKTVLIATQSYILIPYIALTRFLSNNRLKLIIWEHEFHKRRRDVWVYRNSDGIFVTNSAIKRDIIGMYAVNGRKIVISYNPVSSNRLHCRLDKKQLRNKLNLPNKSKLIVYTGKVGIGIKENEYIIEAASILPTCTFVLTGGVPKAIEFYRNVLRKKNLRNVIMTGFIYKYDDIKYYQCAADILVSYYSKYDINVRHNLPAKICEYMSTKNPIVTCDYPALRDLLDNNTALFVEPDKPVALAQGIKKLIDDELLATRLARNAYHRVQNITYDSIARNMLEFVQSI